LSEYAVDRSEQLL